MSKKLDPDYLMNRANFSDEVKHKYRDLLFWLEHELVVAELGTLDAFEDARSALHALTVWYQELGAFTAQDKEGNTQDTTTKQFYKDIAEQAKT